MKERSPSNEEIAAWLMSPVTRWILRAKLVELQQIELDRLFTKLEHEDNLNVIALEYKKFEGYKKAITEIVNIKEEVL
jgi:hypothetical protein